MADVVVFPDVEALLVSYLGTALGVPVASRVPNPRPVQFVRVNRVGGTRRNLVTDRPMVVVEAWAATEAEAAALGELARAHVFALAQTTVGGEWVRSVTEVGGLQSFPDPVSEAPRYQFTVQINTRGRAA